uniref:X8 domain-containing protein n=1 Tax=Kalanchoe fedtschenkoi TaxID=63787 RepID=A0A7N1A9B8_KALFE
MNAANGQTWCIARSSASEADLLNNINYVCGNLKHTSCGDVIGEGGFCFNPNTLYNHASILMDVYYVENGRNPWACDFRGTALVAVTDPSN